MTEKFAIVEELLVSPMSRKGESSQRLYWKGNEQWLNFCFLKDETTKNQLKNSKTILKSHMN